MKKTRLKIISVLLTFLIIMPMFTGCGAGIKATFAFLDDTRKMEVKTVASEGQIQAPDMTGITKNGYEFEGWIAEGTENPAQFPYKMTQSTIFAAKWKPIQYTINYVTNTGETISDRAYSIETATFRLATPANVLGKAFAGWHLKEDLSDAAVFNIRKGSVTGNKTLYAAWERKDIFTVTFESVYLSGGSVEEEFSYKIDINFPDLSDKAPQHYEFAGWRDVLNENIVTMLTEERNYRLEAQFRPVQYQISYVLNGGEWTSAPATVFTAVSAFTLNDIPYREGKQFVGWFDNTDLTGNRVTTVGLGTAYTTNITMYAKWADLGLGQSSIDYRLNGGSLGSDAPLNYSHGTEVTLPVPTRSGYSFEGWTRTNDPMAEKVTKILPGDTGTQTFYAQWNLRSYSLQYELNGGNLSGAYLQSYTVNNTVSLPISAMGGQGRITRTNYIFDGWYDNPGFTGSAVAGFLPGTTTGDKTYYAKWRAEEFTITYNLYDDVQETGKYTIESPAITLMIPERNHYTFQGWYTNSGFTGNPVTVLASGSTGQRYYYAKWLGDEYTVTFGLNGGSMDGNTVRTYRVGDAPNLPVPARSGFTFGGWYTDNTAIETKPASAAYNKLDKEHWQSITLYAKWISGTGTAQNFVFQAEHTNLEGKRNIGVSGGPPDPQDGINRWSISGQTVYTVGWRYLDDLPIVDYYITSDRYVTNAALTIAVGSESVEREFFNSNSIKILVNGQLINWNGNISVPCVSGGVVDTITQFSIGNITLLPGVNKIEFITGPDPGNSGTYSGPDLDYISINSNAVLTWTPDYRWMQLKYGINGPA